MEALRTALPCLLSTVAGAEPGRLAVKLYPGTDWSGVKWTVAAWRPLWVVDRARRLGPARGVHFLLSRLVSIIHAGGVAWVDESCLLAPTGTPCEAMQHVPDGSARGLRSVGTRVRDCPGRYIMLAVLDGHRLPP